MPNEVNVANGREYMKFNELPFIMIDAVFMRRTAEGHGNQIVEKSDKIRETTYAY